MKRWIYIFSFIAFGVLAQFLIHAALEMITIELLTSDYNRYGLGLTWAQWFGVHRVMPVVFLAIGVWFGYKGGVKWWNVIYVEKRFGWPPKWKKRHA